MNLIQVFSFSDDLDLSAETSNPEVISLRGHKIRFKPDNRTMLGRISCEAQKLSFKVALEGYVN
jgi:hypothetical protein